MYLRLFLGFDAFYSNVLKSRVEGGWGGYLLELEVVRNATSNIISIVVYLFVMVNYNGCHFYM